MDTVKGYSLDETQSAKKINKALRSLYGFDHNTSEPLYRLSWSNEQTEVRKGKFSVFYGKIFIREEIGTQRVPKYPYLRNQWVLEKLFYLTGIAEIVAKWSFEPLFAFPAGLPPRLDMCQRVVQAAINGPENKARYTEEDDRRDFDKVVAEDYAFLNDDQEQLGFRTGEAVSFAGLDAPKSVKLYDNYGQEISSGN